MKKFIKILSFVIMFFAFCEGLYAQGTSIQGTDFWLTFGANLNVTSGSVDLQIRIVGTEQAATGTIYFTALTGTAASIPFSVAADAVFTHNLTLAQKQAAYNATMGINNFSVHITSSVPVAVYALNQASATTDATNVLPTTALGTEYYQISYQPESRPASPFPDAYAVVAVQNNTELFHNGASRGILNAGQVYYQTSYTDMTGSHITADKPVAFFAACQSAFIPATVLTSRDHLFQQLAAVHTWGKNFFVPVSHLGRDRVRIVASQNGTNITQTGGILPTTVPLGSQNRLTNLNAGQWVELEVSLANRGCYIQADKPVGICTFLTTDSYNGGGGSDPGQAWLPAIEQTVKSALIAPFIPTGSTNLNAHYALIVTPTNTKNTTMVSVGGAAATILTGGTWYDHSSNYSFYSMPLTNSTSTYVFTNQTELIVLGYGIGNIESYYYLASSAMRNLEAAFYVNDVHYQDFDNDVLCDTVVNLRAALQYANSSSGFLRWYIDGVEQTSQIDEMEWQTNLPVGNHTVEIDVVSIYSDTTRLSATFEVGIAHYDTINTSICLGERYVDNNFDTIPTAAGFIQLEKKYPTTTGCDSIFVVNLTVNPTYNDTIFVKFCGAGNYYDVNGCNASHSDTLRNSHTSTMYWWKCVDAKTSHGCDSIIVIHVTVHPVWDYTINAGICLGKRYNEYGFDTIPIQAGVVTMIHNDTTRYGCDSIVRLNLLVYPAYHDTIKAEICLGETYSEYNFNETPTTAGVFYFYQDSITKIHRCDSIVTLELTVTPTLVTIDAKICENEAYNDNGFDIPPYPAGFYTYTNNDITKSGCDSITILNLTVNPVYDEYLFETIYEDEFYQIGNEQYNKPDNYIVNLPTIAGCDSIINLNLSVLYYPPEITAFSPNQDGKNDYFMAGFKVQIFNRYGMLIYETKTPEEQALGWDGRNNKGQEVDPGMYFYILYNSNGKPRTKSSVEVLKR